MGLFGPSNPRNGFKCNEKDTASWSWTTPDQGHHYEGELQRSGWHLQFSWRALKPSSSIWFYLLSLLRCRSTVGVYLFTINSLDHRGCCSEVIWSSKVLDLGRLLTRTTSLQKNEADPCCQGQHHIHSHSSCTYTCIQKFIPKLREHLLPRIRTALQQETESLQNSSTGRVTSGTNPGPVFSLSVDGSATDFVFF